MGGDAGHAGDLAVRRERAHREGLRPVGPGGIRVGILYLRHVLREFNGNRRLALAAYYQGPAAVRRHGLYRETRVYVRVVLALQRRF